MLDKIRKTATKPRFHIYLLGLMGFLITVYIFHPGYMSFDSMVQYKQAVSGSYGDWHPPIMAITWSILDSIFGLPAMLYVQVAIFWIAIVNFALLAYEKTNKRNVYIGILLAAFLPFILNIAGVIWKDVLAANVLLLAVIISVRMKYTRMSVFISSLLIMYGLLLRTNLLFAVLPLIYLLYSKLDISRLFQYCLIILFFVAYSVANFAIYKTFDVEKERPISAIVIDDLTFVDGEVSDHKLQNIVANSRDCAATRGIRSNTYWRCISNKEREYISNSNHNKVRKEHLKHILGNLTDYTSYRMERFIYFIFPPTEDTYYLQDGMRENDLGLGVTNDNNQKMLKHYVKSVGFETGGFIFKAWFYLILMVVLLLRMRNSSHLYSREAYALVLSGLIYMLTYFPIVVAADFRYVYWSVYTVLFSAILIFISDNTRITRKRVKK